MYTKKILIRPAVESDTKIIASIYVVAKEFMKKTGNPKQWEEGYPSLDYIERDLRNNNLYVLESQGKVHGVFTMIFGIESTYQEIDGAWINDDPYVTIHRLASDGQVKGIFNSAINFVKQQYTNIRIDTFKDNKIMQHLIEKNGFKYCGIINTEAHTDLPPELWKRMAYQWVR